MQKTSWTKGLRFLFKKNSCEWIGMTLGFQETNKQKGRTENSQNIQLVTRHWEEHFVSTNSEVRKPNSVIPLFNVWIY